MTEKKYSPYENFLRDEDLHGPKLLIGEEYIAGMARAMERKMLAGTQSMLDFVRSEIAKRPEIGMQQPTPAPKIPLSQLKQMSPTAKLDHVHGVPAPTLDGLKKPDA